MKKPPFPKRNPGNSPPMIEGGGGVIHLNVKKPPHNERNRKTPPIRSRSYQKGHKCIPKTAILSQPFRNRHHMLLHTTTI